MKTSRVSHRFYYRCKVGGYLPAFDANKSYKLQQQQEAKGCSILCSLVLLAFKFK